MKTKEIPKNEWPAFFDSFSRQHEGWLVTLEILGAEVGAQVEERELAFEGIVDEWDEAQLNKIAIMIGAKPDDHITHSIRHPTQVSLEQTDEGADVALAIRSADGVTALLRFRSPMLPEMVDGVVAQESLCSVTERKGVMNRKSDSEIKQQVLRELKWDSRIAWSTIGVEVNDGIVTMTGMVNGYAKKQAAQEAAHRIAGVLDVANDIEVRQASLFKRTDADVARAVRHVLQWDAFVPDERIQSTVSDGWVTLEGKVDVWRERQDAERSILRLEGVVGVINKITIAPRKIDPKELREEIEYALERRADREAERLRIEVNDGAVDLFGRVHSWQEKRAIVGSISHAPGVAEIRDHLRIDPYF